MPDKIAAPVVSADRTKLASGGGDRQIHLWDMGTSNLRMSLAGEVAIAAHAVGVHLGGCHQWRVVPATDASKTAATG